MIGISAQLDPAEAAAAATATGIGFAIPIDTVKSRRRAAAHDRTRPARLPRHRRRARHARASPAPSRSPATTGCIVQSITPGSGAALAGLRAGTTAVALSGESYRLGGDIIVAANGKPVASEAQLRDVIKAMKPDQTLALQIWRGDTKQTVHVKLGRPPG